MNKLIPVLSLLVFIVLAVFLYYSSAPNTSPNPQEVIRHYQKEWNYPFNIPEVVDACDHFATIDEAKKSFKLSDLTLEPCKEKPDKRYIAFIERDGLYGFLVCTKLPEKYFCCAELSTTETRSYLEWKKRCT